MKNFAQIAVKIKFTTKGKQIREVKCISDIFGRLLYLDFDVVLSYLLTSVSFSLCHISGDMNKTSKTVLIDKLKVMGTTNDTSVKTNT